MLVYADRAEEAEPRALIRALLSEPDPLSALIAAGALEAAVADALCPAEDAEPAPLPLLQRATDALARAWRGEGGAREAAAGCLRAALAGPLPDRVTVREPEGFAFYALCPSQYARAARAFLAAHRPTRVAVLGLRSIGTTLSAVVAAECRVAGAEVRRLTARPRGHPWDRRLALSPPLRDALAQADHVLVVDEGPGISGSSFAAAAEAALEAGRPPARVHLLPSHHPDPASLRSDRARALWGRLPVWHVPFEQAVLPRLEARHGPLRDLSGGLWRAVARPRRRAPVHPWHERRKYLARGGTLLRFVGHGARGARMRARAEALAAAGLSPPVLGLADGFLALEWAPGRPGPALSDAALAAMARHLAHLSRETTGPAPFAATLAMALHNIREGLGEPWAARAAWMERARPAVEGRAAVAGDGRMGPVEWIEAPGGLLKADALDHHDDHFLPGRQDPAWDLACAMVEWRMPPPARARLLALWEAATGDRAARAVLPFHETAYAAFRLGYATLAADALGATWARARDGYARALRAAIARGGAA